MISTGLTGLDSLLGGGIAGGIITDIFGPGGSGKTQLAMQICTNAIHEKIIYHDTSGSFRPERILQLMHARQLAPTLLDNITVARARNTSEQINHLKNISQVNPGLVVIDNITDLFSFEYSKESKSLEKHVKFMEYMHSLSLLCIQRKIPVVITNVVRRSGEQDVENLDKSISIFTHKKIKLTKEGNKFSAQVLPAFGAKKEMSYKIEPEGIVEVT
ncbi:MAG: recombinase RecA [Thaumarchaeota archaeon]|nr:recombinase RecA [Nitrososphaerota archaeon]